jgi:hypothetical protein
MVRVLVMIGMMMMMMMMMVMIIVTKTMEMIPTPLLHYITSAWCYCRIFHPGKRRFPKASSQMDPRASSTMI